MTTPRRLVLVICLALFIAACQNGGDASTSTTSDSTLLTLSPQTTSTTSLPMTTTSPEPIIELSAPRYQIVQRTLGEGVGDEVVVLLDPTSYEALTDIDIQDLISEVVDLFPPIAIAHIVDDPAAANVVGNPDASAAEVASIQDHYFARLDHGFQITFLGPFASSGSNVLGS